MRAMLGLGSFSYRWSCGFRDRVPESPLRPLDLLDRADGLGLKLVQYADNIPLHLRERQEIEELSREAKSRDITIELGMAGFKPAMLATYLELADILGAKLIRASLDAADIEDGLEAAAAQLCDTLPAARAAGVRIALENHFSMTSETLSTLVQMVDVPELGICLDVANSICAGEWPKETINTLAPLAINLHLKDCRFQLDPYGVGFSVVGTPLGQGIVDPKSVLDTLEKHDRDVNVILEHWLPWQGDFATTTAAEDDWIGQSVAHARSLIHD